MSVETPNDPKLSDSGVRRGTCMAGGKAAVEAGAVTHGAVRCSAWLGVMVECRSVSALKSFNLGFGFGEAESCLFTMELDGSDLLVGVGRQTLNFRRHLGRQFNSVVLKKGIQLAFDAAKVDALACEQGTGASIVKNNGDENGEYDD